MAKCWSMTIFMASQLEVSQLELGGAMFTGVEKLANRIADLEKQTEADRETIRQLTIRVESLERLLDRSPRPK